MSTTPPKRIGRPPKSPMEKGTQFSIRLSMLSKLMLEIIARSLNMSLSQAAEHAIMHAAATQTIGDQPISDMARAGLADVFHLLPGGTGIGTATTLSPARIFVPKQVHGPLTDAEKAVAFPDEIRTDEERLFVEVLIDLAHYHGSYPLANKTAGMDLLSMCQSAYQSAVPTFKVVEAWLELHPTPEPPAYVRTAAPSGPSIPKPVKKK